MGYLVQRLGLGRLLTLGTFFIASGLTGYVLSSSWGFFLGCAFVAGMGVGSIHGGLNAYAAEQFSGRQVNWMHACYGLGATIGPLIMTAAIQQTGTWRWGYTIVAVCMLGMSVAFALTRRRWSNHRSTVYSSQPPPLTPIPRTYPPAPGQYADRPAESAGAAANRPLLSLHRRRGHDRAVELYLADRSAWR
jgi:MFS family permease